MDRPLEPSFLESSNDAHLESLYMFEPLSLPEFFEAGKAGSVYRVPYQERALFAERFRREHRLRPAAEDHSRVGLWLIDVQNTFCIPEFELFVAGRSGRGAVDDSARVATFVYRNLGLISEIHASLDTHRAMQIFHPLFLMTDTGRHPEPMTLVGLDDVVSGKIRVNPRVVDSLSGETLESLQLHLEHYCRRLSHEGKFQLMVWPYHAMLGGIGHALVSIVEEAVFVHTLARGSQCRFTIKGENPRTENYSVLRPEVLESVRGEAIGTRNEVLVEQLLSLDAVVVAGQAKSHCVSSTISDLLDDIQRRDASLAQKIYLLDDCSSSVVAPGVVDYTEASEEAYQRFSDNGMHRVLSTAPIVDWPGIAGEIANAAS